MKWNTLKYTSHEKKWNESWDGMGWDGMKWNRMEWDGMGGMGWDGMGWDGMRLELNDKNLTKAFFWISSAFL